MTQHVLPMSPPVKGWLVKVEHSLGGFDSRIFTCIIKRDAYIAANQIKSYTTAVWEIDVYMPYDIHQSKLGPQS